MVWLDVDHDRGLDEAVRDVGAATKGQCGAVGGRGVNEALEPACVALGHDAAEVVAVLRAWAVELVGRRLQLGHERVAPGGGDEDVVGRDAGLASVDALAPHDSPRGQAQVREPGVHDHGALAAQFQRHLRRPGRRRALAPRPTKALARAPW